MIVVTCSHCQKVLNSQDDRQQTVYVPTHLCPVVLHAAATDLLAKRVGALEAEIATLKAARST